MPETNPTLFDIAPEAPTGALDNDQFVADAITWLCTYLPHKLPPYSARNWGGNLHSLCSYQGKLKPSIAHFLVSLFSEPGDVILDPMSGVGTIPLEARLQGRHAVAGDLSPLAYTVSRTKIELLPKASAEHALNRLLDYVNKSHASVEQLIAQEHANFGLNGPIVEYFQADTLREVLIARQYFRDLVTPTIADSTVLTALLHVLHGNRPYALSRHSHPITPLKPSGGAEYRSLADRVGRRVAATSVILEAMENSGSAYHCDFAGLPIEPGTIDAVITSPPFSGSIRFYSSNWMRLWFSGWNPSDFKTRPAAFLESEQKVHFHKAYRRFLASMAAALRPGGLLVLHLGETSKFNMAREIETLLSPSFTMLCEGREDVEGTESHGLSDKGATRAHAYLVARRR